MAAAAADRPSFAEIRRIIADMPGPDHEAATLTAMRERQLLKPPGALGRLEAIAAHIAAWQGRTPPQIRHPRVCVFAGGHGIARRGVSAYPPEVTGQMVKAFLDGHAAINQLCIAADADLRVFELSVDQPSFDIVEAPAMSEGDAAHALTYGMTAVEQGVDLLAVGEMGIGNTAVAAALAMGLFGGDAADWVGPGTGVAGEALAHKRAMVTAAVTRHRSSTGAAEDGLDVLASLGGLELAAIAGAILAARHGRVPVLLDGFVATAAAAVLYRCHPGALDHCLAAHLSPEPGHRRLLEIIGLNPLLDFGMRLGEASGAALAIPLVRAACRTHAGMGTFADAGVSGG